MTRYFSSFSFVFDSIISFFFFSVSPRLPIYCLIRRMQHLLVTKAWNVDPTSELAVMNAMKKGPVKVLSIITIIRHLSLWLKGAPTRIVHHSMDWIKKWVKWDCTKELIKFCPKMKWKHKSMNLKLKQQQRLPTHYVLTIISVENQ